MPDLEQRVTDLEARFDELIQQMGDQIAPFPDQGIDGFLSHFILTLQFQQGDLAGKVVSLQMPPSTQTVSRSLPFIYEGPDHAVDLTIPAGSALPATITESDFIVRPPEFFEVGKETVWMQILNLDARYSSPDLGSIRIILGETLNREYPDIFVPSLGVAQSLGSSGFPARLFFNPYAVVETDFGIFRAIHGTLSYGRVTSFPPVNTPVSIDSVVPLESVAKLREEIASGNQAALRETFEANPQARLIALSHPIDVAIQLPGEEAFSIVEGLTQK